LLIEAIDQGKQKMASKQDKKVCGFAGCPKDSSVISRVAPWCSPAHRLAARTQRFAAGNEYKLMFKCTYEGCSSDASPDGRFFPYCGKDHRFAAFILEEMAVVTQEPTANLDAGVCLYVSNYQIRTIVLFCNKILEPLGTLVCTKPDCESFVSGNGRMAPYCSFACRYSDRIKDTSQRQGFFKPTALDCSLPPELFARGYVGG
jgi:hypothetical protein